MQIPYIPSDELLKAKEVAEYLNRPLLLSGEPGTGKTKFAEYVKLKHGKDLFVFNTKSTSVSRDLFYTYDAIGHFANKNRNALEFIKLEALGKAIVNANGREKVRSMLLGDVASGYQISSLSTLLNKEEIIDRFLEGCDGNDSVVLIDEVDKAPRDFPNDILNEIENLEFEIREINVNLGLRDVDKSAKDKIFVILTSNFEKNLPEAFLRRCIYHHIEFMNDVNKLKEIINVHISQADQDQLTGRINEFLKIRSTPTLQKKPATSELIDWIKWLVYSKSLNHEVKTGPEAMAILIKKNEDLKLLEQQK